MARSDDAVVAARWRYPVTSMQGERLPVVEVQADGVIGDRRSAIGAGEFATNRPEGC